MPHKYTPEQDSFIMINISGQSIMELTERFNKHFGLDLKYSQIRAYAKNRHLCCGFDSRFKKGNPSQNKGKKGVGGRSLTRFKPGIIPRNYKPVGSEVLKADGYIAVKVADPNKWRQKQAIIWESVYGPLQKGEVVIFADGDKTNFDINNLIKINRRKLAVLNRRGLINNSSELTRAGILVADIILKSSEIKKRKA